MPKSQKFSLSALKNDLFGKLPHDLRDSKIIDTALNIAFESHKGQTRQLPNPSLPPVPYIVHPVGVAKLTLEHWKEDDLTDSLETVVAAALTHDVIEDSDINFSELSQKLSERCATIVLSLTKPVITHSITREERNKIFLKQIKEAGSTSVYIKLCDILHNLSRPKAMPLSLLDKTLRKASGPYMELSEGLSFKNRFDDLLRVAIDSGMEILSSQDGRDLGFDPYDYSDFVKYQASVAKSKVLEMHDIIRALQRIPGIFCCSSLQHYLFIKNVFSKEGLTLKDEDIKKIEHSLLDKGFYHISPPIFSKSQIKSLSFSKIITVPLFNNLLVSDTPYISLAINLKEAPKWVDEVTLCPIVAFMSDRLLAQQRNNLKKISDAIKHFNLDLEPNIAQKFNISIAQLSEIKSVLDAADYIRRTLLLSVDGLLKSANFEEDVDRIESRTKRADSCIIKANSRHLNKINNLDDVVGIRFVAISQGSKKQLIALLTDWLTNPEGLHLNSITIPKESIVVNEICSNAGYSATHIRFIVDYSDKANGKIGCEIQLRTLFEDTWARISQAMAYKQRMLSISKTKKLLKDLAELRDASDKRFQKDLNSIQ